MIVLIVHHIIFNIHSALFLVLQLSGIVGWGMILVVFVLGFLSGIGVYVCGAFLIFLILTFIFNLFDIQDLRDYIMT